MTEAGPAHAWRVVPITRRYAKQIAQWRYPPPYHGYQMSANSLPVLLEPANAYHVLVDPAEKLIGFCCFGQDARVPGGHRVGWYDGTALDVGLGMRPDLTGQGHGREFLDVILRHAARAYAPAGFRLTVATFNERARRLYRNAGFTELDRCVSPAGNGSVEFVLMRRPTGDAGQWRPGPNAAAPER